MTRICIRIFLIRSLSIRIPSSEWELVHVCICFPFEEGRERDGAHRSIEVSLNTSAHQSPPSPSSERRGWRGCGAPGRASKLAHMPPCPGFIKLNNPRTVSDAPKRPAASAQCTHSAESSRRPWSSRRVCARPVLLRALACASLLPPGRFVGFVAHPTVIRDVRASASLEQLPSSWRLAGGARARTSARIESTYHLWQAIWYTTKLALITTTPRSPPSSKIALVLKD